jgi:arrestin-related trafficking adapter 3/6
VIERIEYHTLSNSIARTEPYHAIDLLSLKYPSKEGEGEPLLPLMSSFENSPLYTMLKSDDDASHLAATFESPGPWTFHHSLRIPPSCSVLRFTIRNPASNITITHSLKVILRVQRGDELSVDSKTGKPKLFDIVVVKPVDILSVSVMFQRSAECAFLSSG